MIISHVNLAEVVDAGDATWAALLVSVELLHAGSDRLAVALA
jgi:hypothetical protein